MEPTMTHGYSKYNISEGGVNSQMEPTRTNGYSKYNIPEGGENSDGTNNVVYFNPDGANKDSWLQ